MEKIFSTEQRDRSKVSFHVMNLGLNPEVIQRLRDLLAGFQLTNLAIDMDKLVDPVDPAPDLILCNLPPRGITVSELAQTLRMVYQGQPIFLICTDRAGYDRYFYRKNGFSESFLLPLDWTALRSALTDTFTRLSQGAIRSYRSVRLLDIRAGTTLNFDTAIYLPLNDRYIKYSAAGDTLDEARIAQLEKHKMRAIFVPNDQIQEFYRYTAVSLSDLCNSGTISETEKRDKLKTAVRDLMGGIFNDKAEDATFDHGRELASDCQEIVRAFITTAPQKDWCERILTAMADVREVYTHGGNVSTYAALFSMGLGIGRPEELAIAGILHDIGLVDVPAEIQEKPEPQWTPEEKALYEKHPNFGVEILKKRRMILPENVLKIVAQHHESFDGSGYPEGIMGGKILPEAQILAFADYFDYLTSINRGQALMSPREVLDFLVLELASGRGGAKKFDPALVERVIGLFSKQVKG